MVGVDKAPSRRIPDLCKTLRKAGVTFYKDADLEIHLGEAPIATKDDEKDEKAKPTDDLARRALLQGVR